MGIPWTQVEIELSVSLRDFDQMTFKEISKELVKRGYPERSSNAIKEKVKKFIQDNKSKEEVFSPIANLERSYRNIAKDLLKDPDFLERLEKIVNKIVDERLGVSYYYQENDQPCTNSVVCTGCGNCVSDE